MTVSPDHDPVSWADSLVDVFEASDPGPVARPSGAHDMARLGFRVDDYGVVTGWETDQ